MKTLQFLILFLTALSFHLADAQEAFPTSYSIIKNNIKSPEDSRDFRYTVSETNSNFRDLYRLDCDRNLNPMVRKYSYNPNQNLGGPSKTQSFPLTKNSQPSCAQILKSIPARNLPAALILSPELGKAVDFESIQNSDQSAFDQMDFHLISNINFTFYGNNFESGTMSFQHGHKTEKVYVFLPGFTEDASAFYATSIRIFQRGHNVIIGTLPGFTNDAWNISQIHAGNWTIYADYIVRMARSYGDKVIVVGNSSGGNLAARLADEGLIDGLYLIQPFFGFSTLAKVAVRVGPQVPEILLAYIGRRLGLAEMGDTRPIFSQIRHLIQISFIPGKKLQIPVVAVIAQNDEAVSSEATLHWLHLKAPQGKVLQHREGHLHRPTDANSKAWDLLINLPIK